MPLFNFREIHLPYCIQKNAAGKYVVLNREYRPLGFLEDHHPNYETGPAVKYNITPTIAKKLSCRSLEDTNKIYLYNDGFVPEVSAKNMAMYLEKLKLLAKLRRRD